MRTEIELDMVFIANLVHELALVGETVLFLFLFFCLGVIWCFDCKYFDGLEHMIGKQVSLWEVLPLYLYFGFFFSFFFFID